MPKGPDPKLIAWSITEKLHRTHFKPVEIDQLASEIRTLRENINQTLNKDIVSKEELKRLQANLNVWDMAKTHATAAQFTDPPLEEGYEIKVALVGVIGGETGLISYALGRSVDVNHKYEAGRSLLHFATHAVVVKALLQAGAKIDAIDDNNQSAAHLTATHGHPVTLKALIEGGAKIDGVDKHGKTPLRLAVEHGHVKVVDVLLSADLNPHVLYESNKTLMHLAAATGNIPMIERLHQAGLKVTAEDDTGGTPIVYAQMEGKEAAVVRLKELARGAAPQPAHPEP